MSETKSRVPNFTKSETELLTNLVKKYSHILENKKSDAVNNTLKEETWMKLAQEFNSLSAVFFRTHKTLRAKYENIKKSAKSKYGTYRRSMYATGGGPPPNLDLTQEEEIVMELSTTSVTGLSSRYDSDEIIEKVINDANIGEIDDGKLLPPPQTVNDHKINIDKIMEHTAETPPSSKFILKRKRATPLARKNPESFNNTMQDYSDVAMKKKKLLDMQIAVEEAKIKQGEKEHELRCILLQLEIDIKRKMLQNLN